MKTIYKYPLAMHTGPQVVKIPIQNAFRLFDFQGRIPCVWFEVVTGGPTVNRNYRILATGQEIKIDNHTLDWRSSRQILTKTGLEVWHLFEEYD